MLDRKYPNIKTPTSSCECDRECGRECNCSYSKNSLENYRLKDSLENDYSRDDSLGNDCPEDDRLESNNIKNEGYVPFKYFQYIIFVLIFCTIIYSKQINGATDNIISQFGFDKNTVGILRWIILSIPLMLMAYYDYKYNSFSFDNIKIFDFVSQEHLLYIVKILGAYSLIYVLSLDLGIGVGSEQFNITKHPIVSFLLFFCMAYVITRGSSEVLIGTLLYFNLRYTLSSSILNRKC